MSERLDQIRARFFKHCLNIDGTRVEVDRSDFEWLLKEVRSAEALKNEVREFLGNVATNHIQGLDEK